MIVVVARKGYGDLQSNSLRGGNPVVKALKVCLKCPIWLNVLHTRAGVMTFPMDAAHSSEVKSAQSSGFRPEERTVAW